MREEQMFEDPTGYIETFNELHPVIGGFGSRLRQQPEAEHLRKLATGGPRRFRMRGKRLDDVKRRCKQLEMCWRELRYKDLRERVWRPTALPFACGKVSEPLPLALAFRAER